MLTVVIIVGIIIFLIKVYKPKKKDAEYYTQHPELLRTVKYQSHEIHGIQSMLNLGLDNLEGLDYFSYDKGQLFVKGKNGKSISGNIKDITATFVMGKYGCLECTLSFGRNKLCFGNFSGLFTDSEYMDIFSILNSCGSVGGQSDFEAYKAKYEFKSLAKEKVKELFVSGNSQTISELSQDLNNHMRNQDDDILYCTSCGQTNKKGYKFCQKCGRPIDASSSFSSFREEKIESEQTYETAIISQTCCSKEAESKDFCPTCGKEIDLGSVFCQFCGTKVETKPSLPENHITQVKFTINDKYSKIGPTANDNYKEIDAVMAKTEQVSSRIIEDENSNKGIIIITAVIAVISIVAGIIILKHVNRNKVAVENNVVEASTIVINERPVQWETTKYGFKVPDNMVPFDEIWVSEAHGHYVSWAVNNIDLVFWPVLGNWSVEGFPEIGRYLTKDINIKSITYTNSTKDVFSGYASDGRIWYMKKKILNSSGAGRADFLILIYPKSEQNTVSDLIDEVKNWKTQDSATSLDIDKMDKYVASILNPNHYTEDEYGRDIIKEYRYSPNKRNLFVVVSHDDITAAGSFDVLILLKSDGEGEKLISSYNLNVVFTETAINTTSYYRDFDNPDEKLGWSIACGDSVSFDYNGNKLD